MVLNIDATFEGKLTWAFKIDMRNLASFRQSLKIGFLMGSFIQSKKCMSLRFTGVFCVMTLKNDTSCEE